MNISEALIACGNVFLKVSFGNVLNPEMIYKRIVENKSFNYFIWDISAVNILEYFLNNIDEYFEVITMIISIPDYKKHAELMKKYGKSRNIIVPYIESSKLSEKKLIRKIKFIAPICDISSFNQSDESPLTISASEKKYKLFSALIDLGANVYESNKRFALLDIPFIEGDMKLFKILIKKVSNLPKTDKVLCFSRRFKKKYRSELEIYKICRKTKCSLKDATKDYVENLLYINLDIVRMMLKCF